MFMRKAVLCASFALGMIALPATAQVSVGFSVGIAPPPARVEVVPAPREGYYWAPGYWRWEEPRRTHIWVEGRFVEARPGYRWRADRWVARDRAYYYEPGGYEVIVR
jgi:hypothetical protein